MVLERSLRTPRTVLVYWFTLLLLAEEVSAKRPRSTPAVFGSTEMASLDPRVACALSLTRSLLADSLHITVVGRAPWVNDFLQATSVPVSLLELTSTQQVIHNLMSDVTFVVTDGAGTSSFVEAALKTLEGRQAPNMRIVVWWQTGDAEGAMEVAKDREAVRLIVISGSRGSLQIFKYREQCENRERVPTAVLAGECGQMNLLQDSGALFLDLSHFDFGGCPLKLTTWRDPPYRILSERPDGDYDLTGTHSFLAYKFAECLNATLAVGYWYRWQTDVLFSLYTSGDDIVGPAFYQGCDLFVVPSGLGEEADRFHLVHREFTPVVWALASLAGILVALLLALSWRRVKRHPLQDAALFVLSVFLGNNNSTRLTSDWDRILSASWLLSSIVLGTGYVAVLHSLQAVPQKTPEINSLVQLEQTGLPILGSESSTEVWKITEQHSEGNATLQALAERASGVDDIKGALDQLGWNRTVAMLIPWELYLNDVSALEKAAGRKLLHRIPGFCTRVTRIQYFRLVFPNSPLSIPLTKWMTRWLDAGLLHFLHKELVYHWPDSIQRWSPLGLHNVSVTFVLLGIGFAVSALVSIVEYFVPLLDLANAKAVLQIRPLRGPRQVW